jgi:hypothetical protein
VAYVVTIIYVLSARVCQSPCASPNTFYAYEAYGMALAVYVSALIFVKRLMSSPYVLYICFLTYIVFSRGPFSNEGKRREHLLGM